MAPQTPWKFFGRPSRHLERIRRKLDAMFEGRTRRPAEAHQQGDPVLVAFTPGGKAKIYHFKRPPRPPRADYTAPTLRELGPACHRETFLQRVPATPRLSAEEQQERLDQDQPV
ncbi:hypothetical protein [Lujinxingia litoralis]|uniref:hypothetical protein n=1 Tax=Lujinxingia litoralis TaxID=2211119 RepID=UPI0011B93F76|nr:hypothetical protein [Lujinxingia litoralis]